MVGVAAALLAAGAAGAVSVAAPAAAGGKVTSTILYVAQSNPPHVCQLDGTSQAFPTIQEAINCAEANGGSFVINVAPGTYMENLRLGGELTPGGRPNSLTIVGTGGASNTIIDGQYLDRTIASYLLDPDLCSEFGCTQVTATIRGFTITHGAGKVIHDDLLQQDVAVGGGVYNGPGSNLTLVNDIVTDNDVTQRDDGAGGFLVGLGGGIFNDGFGALTLSSTTVSNNTATAGGGIAAVPMYYACPAVLCFAGDVAIRSSVVSNNHATGYGGAVVTSTNGTVTISSSTLTGNEALGTDWIMVPNEGPLPWSGMGGAIASVPALYDFATDLPVLPGGRVSITSSSVTTNTATAGGGAIVNIGAKLSTSGGTTSYNQAGDGPGGAILNLLEASASIQSPTIRNNITRSYGGGVANCIQSTVNLFGGKIQANAADPNYESGGGIAADYSSSWTAVNTAIRNNTPDQTATVAGYCSL